MHDLSDKQGCGSGSALSKTSETLEAQNRAVEGPRRSQWGLKMKPKRVYRPVVEDCHHLDAGQDPDPH
jgi:hypothetical protein